MSIGNRIAAWVGLLFGLVAMVMVVGVNRQLKIYALHDAQRQARIILDRNLAIHTYINSRLKPNLLPLHEPAIQQGYFDPVWMSSTYAIREINNLSKTFSDHRYSYKECAINARSPENEADPFERAFIEQLNADPNLVEKTELRFLAGAPYFIMLRRGETMETTCLRCHSTPAAAPVGLVERYGGTRSFGRQEKEVVSAISIHIPLAPAFDNANRISRNISLLLLLLLAGLFLLQLWLYRRLLFVPLRRVSRKAEEIAGGLTQVGEQIPLPKGRELLELTTAFNAMSVSLKEKLHQEQSQAADLLAANGQLRVSEERYRSLIANIRAGVVVHGADSRLRSCNFHARDLLGGSEEELCGKSSSDPAWHFLREDGGVMPVAEYPVNLVLATGQPLRDLIAGIARPAPLPLVWVLVNADPLRDELGEIQEVIVTLVDLSERKRAEEALHEGQQVFRSLVENSPDIIARYDRECRRTYVNPVYLQVAKIPQEKLLATSPSQLSPLPADGARVLEALLRQVLAQGATATADIQWPMADGRDHWYNIHAYPEFDRDGRVASVMTISRDITARKEREEERLTNLKSFESLDKVNRALLGTTDLETMTSAVLDTILDLFGCDRAFLLFPCDPESPTWQVPYERTRPEFPGVLALGVEMAMDPEVAASLRLVLATDGPAAFGPGTERPLPTEVAARFNLRSYLGMAIYPLVGSPWQFGIHQCSSPRIWSPEENRLFQEIGRRLADALTTLLIDRDLRESEAKYRRIVDTANEGIWGLGADTLTTFVNSRMAAMIGYRSEEMSGRPVTDFMFEEDAPDHLRKMENRKQGVAEHYERRFRHRDGTTVWTLASAAPIFDERQQFAGSFAMFTEITEMKRAEEELGHYRERLEALVHVRTAELDRKNKELEQFNQLFVGRELRMMELKKRIQHLESKNQVVNP